MIHPERTTSGCAPHLAVVEPGSSEGYPKVRVDLFLGVVHVCRFGSGNFGARRPACVREQRRPRLITSDHIETPARASAAKNGPNEWIRLLGDALEGRQRAVEGLLVSRPRRKPPHRLFSRRSDHRGPSSRPKLLLRSHPGPYDATGGDYSKVLVCSRHRATQASRESGAPSSNAIANGDHSNLQGVAAR